MRKHSEYYAFAAAVRLLIEKEGRISQLEVAVERAAEATVDKDRLLEVMQGDKTALSRAIAQNKELKNQLAELQNSFVKMVCTTLCSCDVIYMKSANFFHSVSFFGI